MQEEMIHEVDWDDNIIATHSVKRLKEIKFVHRSSLVIPKTTDGKFILCKRAKNKYPFPDTWCCAIGGKVRAKETYEEAAIREMLEEGKVSADLEFITKYAHKKDDYPCIFSVFTTKEEVNIESLKPDISEIQYFKSFELEEIRQMINKNPDEFAPTFITIFLEFYKAMTK